LGNSAPAFPFSVFLFFGDLFCKELCRDIVCELASSWRRIVALLCGNRMDHGLPIDDQFIQRGRAESKRNLEPVRPRAAETADAERLYRPTTS
jgi:hypothetical protein